MFGHFYQSSLTNHLGKIIDISSITCYICFTSNTHLWWQSFNRESRYDGRCGWYINECLNLQRVLNGWGADKQSFRDHLAQVMQVLAKIDTYIIHDIQWLGEWSINMGVSKNSGTPKSSILIGFETITNHPFLVVLPLFLETSICENMFLNEQAEQSWFLFLWSCCPRQNGYPRHRKTPPQKKKHHVATNCVHFSEIQSRDWVYSKKHSTQLSGAFT